MSTEIPPSTGLLVLTALLLFPALVAVAALRESARARVGAEIFRSRPAHRRAALTALAGLALLVPLVPGISTWVALLLLGQAALLAWLSPTALDSAVGAGGVRAGFEAAALEELEEWRLTGEHLRWRVRGRWFSSALPVEHHPAVRARLEALAGGRESRFAH